MGEEELIEEWTNKLEHDLGEAKGPGYTFPADERKIVENILHKVFLVGTEAGREKELIRKQLESHGKPHGIG